MAAVGRRDYSVRVEARSVLDIQILESPASKLKRQMFISYSGDSTDRSRKDSSMIEQKHNGTKYLRNLSGK